jgi:cytidine deaminase
VDRALVAAAQGAMKHAYAPYSRFAVGAAARSVSGAVHDGANMENASYGLTMCAEVGALTRSVAAGDFRIETIAVIGGPQAGGSAGIVTPCGRCRQLILEASHVSGVDVRVLSCSADLQEVLVAPISELLPHGFGPRNLV